MFIMKQINSLSAILSIVFSSICLTNAEVQPSNIGLVQKLLVQKVKSQKEQSCQPSKCPDEEQTLACGFSAAATSYKMFPSKCALKAYSECYDVYNETPLEFCIKEHNKVVIARRLYGESCPVFCPSYWRPVCGANKHKSYVYRAFNNGCYMDMLNCRGEDDDMGYVEVPLEYCQKHSMKNMFKEQILLSNTHDYRDYNLA